MPPSKWTLAERFFEKVIQSSTDACVYWPFGKDGKGYGVTWNKGASVRAHVHVCRLVHGERPPGKKEVAHSCNRKICVNPRHLRWATRTENEADKITHRTKAIGERHGQAKLTDDAVKEIRRLRGAETQRNLARRFGVGQTTIRYVQIGRNWAHVK